MKVVNNTVDLKNITNKILAEVMKGNPVIVTYRGKLAASILPLKEEDLEDFIIEHSPSIRKKIKHTEKDSNHQSTRPVQETTASSIGCRRISSLFCV